MLIRFTLLLMLALPLFATLQLQQEYHFTEPTIYSTTLFPHAKKKFILFNISKNRTKYRTKSSKIKKLFAEHNLTIKLGSIRYVNFIKKSPINTDVLKLRIKERYESFYKNIHVNRVIVSPRSYLSNLSNDFKLIMHEKNLKHPKGVISIKTIENKRIFFDYEVDATIEVFRALHPLKRGDTLSPLIVQKKQIEFNSFNALPLEHVNTKEYRLKRSIKKNHVITLRDIELYPIIKKGNNVLVELKSGSVVVQFSAIASQDGCKNDIISIQKRDGRRIKARVIAPGRVEIQ